MDAEQIVAAGIAILLAAIGATIVVFWVQLDPSLSGCEDLIERLQPAERLEGLNACLNTIKEMK